MATVLTFLHIVESNDIDVITKAKELIENGLDMNDINNRFSWTPLHCACKNSDSVELIQLLLSKNSNINAVDKTGKTPLLLATEYYPQSKMMFGSGFGSGFGTSTVETTGSVTVTATETIPKTNLDVIKLLIDNGATITDKDYNNCTTLHYAAKFSNSTELLLLLLNHNIDVNCTDNFMKTPLHYSVEYNSELTITKLLLEHSANSMARDINSSTILHYACLGCDSTRVYRVIQLLLTNTKVDINAIDKNGKTPLHYACKSNYNQEVVRLLVDSGANMMLEDYEYFTPLDIANMISPTDKKLFLFMKEVTVTIAVVVCNCIYDCRCNCISC